MEFKTTRNLRDALGICIDYEVMCESDMQVSTGTILSLVRELNKISGVDTSPLEREAQRAGYHNNISVARVIQEYEGFLLDNPPNIYRRTTQMVQNGLERLKKYTRRVVPKAA